MTTTEGPRAGRVGGVVLALSLMVHGALAAALGLAGAGDGRDPVRPATEVALDVKPPPPRPPAALPPPPPPLAPPPPRAPHARREPAPRPVATPPAPATPPVEHAPPPDDPVDLTGTTLTNDSAGAAWASAVGNGAPMNGPAGAVRRRPPTATARGRGDAGDPLVASADLGRHPEPPDLDGELARQYPEEARRAGASGQAEVRARVRPDGALDHLRVLASTGPAFADACRRMLASSRWTPPRDRAGATCATEIRYTCRFEVNR